MDAGQRERIEQLLYGLPFWEDPGQRKVLLGRAPAWAPDLAGHQVRRQPKRGRGQPAGALRGARIEAARRQASGLRPAAIPERLLRVRPRCGHQDRASGGGALRPPSRPPAAAVEGQAVPRAGLFRSPPLARLLRSRGRASGVDRRAQHRAGPAFPDRRRCLGLRQVVPGPRRALGRIGARRCARASGQRWLAHRGDEAGGDGLADGGPAGRYRGGHQGARRLRGDARLRLGPVPRRHRRR